MNVRRWLAWVGGVSILVVLIGLGYGLILLRDNMPVTYADDQDHFKYGSTGGEQGWKNQLGFGVPYWIWVAMPELFPNELPDHTAGQGYKAFGMIYEDGKDPRFDLPIGMSMRRTMGIDRVYFTCSVCHTGSYRETADGKRHVVLGMPANTFNFGRLAEFLRDSAKDWRFQSSYMLPKIAELGDLRERMHPAGSVQGYRPAEFGLINRLAFRYVGVSLMRDQLISLLGRLDFIKFDTWGPGRVDTFDPPKALLGFRMDREPPAAMNGIADFPSVWNQRSKKGLALHWDGNNCSVDERNLSAGFGTGATPATVDPASVIRIADWLWDRAKPDAFPPAHRKSDLMSRGGDVYREYCQHCHGTGAPPFRAPNDGSLVGEVTPLDMIGTDRKRLDTYTPELARAQGSLYAGHPLAGDDQCREYFEDVCKPAVTDADVEKFRRLRAQCYPARFSHFRKTDGYANMPLDGLWLRAPYLHNGSVPTLRALLEPQSRRPSVFYIGYDVYDFDDVGFVTAGPEAEKFGWRVDTAAEGNGNGGHEGRIYGTELGADDKNALIEYLKSF